MALLLVLTVTTLNFGAQDDLPRVSYVKAIDVWFLGMNSFHRFPCWEASLNEQEKWSPPEFHQSEEGKGTGCRDPWTFQAEMQQQGQWTLYITTLQALRRWLQMLKQFQPFQSKLSKVWLQTKNRHFHTGTRHTIFFTDIGLWVVVVCESLSTFYFRLSGVCVLLLAGSSSGHLPLSSGQQRFRGARTTERERRTQNQRPNPQQVSARKENPRSLSSVVSRFVCVLWHGIWNVLPLNFVGEDFILIEENSDKTTRFKTRDFSIKLNNLPKTRVKFMHDGTWIST